jgi:hypothetical protein
MSEERYTPYTSFSEGETLNAETMHLARLANAVRKMERVDPTSEQLPALQECLARRQAQWAADHPEDAGR